LSMAIFTIRTSAFWWSKLLSLIVLSLTLLIGISQLAAVPESTRRMQIEVKSNIEAVDLWQVGLADINQKLTDFDQRNVLIIVNSDVDLEPTVAVIQWIKLNYSDAKAFTAVAPGMNSDSERAQILLGIGEAGSGHILGISKLCIFMNSDVGAYPGCSEENSTSIFARAM